MRTFLGVGAGPGIGIATAERFAREGFRTVLAARNSGRTQALAEGLRNDGYEAHARDVDAGNPADVAALIGDVQREFGAADVLHYNAAAMRRAALADQPRETFVNDLAVNVGGAMAAVQAVAPTMFERRSGTILLTGGGFAIRPHPNFLSLSVGKAALRAMALGLFETFRENGVHIALVTVSAYVLPGSREAAGVAQTFWELHDQPAPSWEAEMTYGGQA